MVIIFGQRMCGRVDQVPGTCYVATRFFHLYYVPLIPLSSWVIIEGTENSSGFRGQQIGLSGKSILFGWVQTFLVVFGLISSIWGAIQIGEQQRLPNNLQDGIIRLVLGLMCLGAWLLFTIRPFRAGSSRADQLREHLGMPTEIPEDEFV